MKEHPHLTDAEHAIYDLMSDLSEDWYFAGWLDGIEVILWTALTDGVPASAVNQERWAGPVAAALVRLAELSKAADVWVVWDEDGVKAIPLSEWTKRYEETK